MRLVLVFIALVTTQAQADPAFLRCLGPEMAQRTAAVRDAAPCATDPDCEPMPLSLYVAAVEPTCLGEAVDRCTLTAVPSSCLRHLVGHIDDLTDDLRPRLNETRIAAAKRHLNAFHRRSIDMAMRRHLEGSENPCKDPDFLERLRSMTRDEDIVDAACAAAGSFQAYQQASALERRLTSAEAETR
ncbi:hypothetical protein [Jannaschia marina]|uniref:hypothetical protein n=1 Tax=Jannaschia marina TaxID=2741674 RepID=UPI0015CD2302|nr:hypothetical protein [Jannaschia marina]